jgi:hypothetical protein
MPPGPHRITEEDDPEEAVSRRARRREDVLLDEFDVDYARLLADA